MALRAKPPDVLSKRLKMFVFGAAGVGKTTACIQFPQSYIIDAERGAENYDRLINAGTSHVLQTTDEHDVIAEMKTLLSERHPFRTLVIDPITPLYDDLLEKCAASVGTEWGRHYGEANRHMKRMANLVMALDMNVIITAHAKVEYGENQTKLGNTFDGWKRLDYWFDLVIELQRRGQQRIGRVVKTRIESFPDGQIFDWSYEAIRDRYGASIIERQAEAVEMARPEQVTELKDLLSVIRLPEGTVEKWLAKSQAESWEEMRAVDVAKCITYLRGQLPKPVTPPPSAGAAEPMKIAQ